MFEHLSIATTVLSRGTARVLAACLATLLAAAALPESASAQTVFNVSAQSFQDYSIDGAPDPTLTLTRGQTYQFVVNAPGHPFFLKTVSGAGTANQYNDGVVNNGITSGTLSFVVPGNAPNQLFYQCSAHAPMTGVLNIVGVGAPPVPSGTPGALVLMAVLLLSAAAFTLSGARRERRCHQQE